MKILLVVDLQVEFKDNDGQYERILDFVNHAKENGYDRVIATVCKNNDNTAFVKYENWYDCYNPEPLEFNPDDILIKYGYGLNNYNILPKTDQYDIIGFNTDACVLKIALDLFDNNYDFHVLTDYCYSNSGYTHHINGVELLKRLMSKAIKEN